MKTNNKFIGGGSYESPQVTVIDIHSEGILCASGDFSVDDFIPENEDPFLTF